MNTRRHALGVRNQRFNIDEQIIPRILYLTVSYASAAHHKSDPILTTDYA